MYHTGTGAGAVIRAMAIEDNQKLTVEFVEGRQVAEFAANGAFGGAAPLGEVVVWFYFERGRSPIGRKEHYEATQGRFDLRETEHRGADLEREIVARAVLSPRAAIQIGRWLAQQGEEAMRQAQLVEETVKSMEGDQ